MESTQIYNDIIYLYSTPAAILGAVIFLRVILNQVATLFIKSII